MAAKKTKKTTSTNTKRKKAKATTTAGRSATKKKPALTIAPVKKGDFHHWLIKSEPSVYAFDALVRDGKSSWEGVRNFEARNAMRAMTKGDLCLYYHSNEGKEIVGVARVAREAYPDPTADEGDWSMVDVEPVKAFAEPVTLAAIKAHPELSQMLLVRRSRISVVPVKPDEFAGVLSLAKTKL